MVRIPGIQRLSIRRQTISEMLATMREFGRLGSEVLVLWLGRVNQEETAAEVTQAFVPPQKPIKSEEGVGYFVSGETLFQLNRELARSGLRLIAQVHSHPQHAYHSEADDRYAIVTAEGGLSLVVPNFGHAHADPKTWATYRLRGREWCEVPESEMRSLFDVKDV
jgi:hypothetical protein